MITAAERQAILDELTDEGKAFRQRFVDYTPPEEIV
ncbi:hypothetical protein LCGC14_1003190 [marine sediment metagenome]|uniref:Uncharacterized protein n=1 Tax=marine sediment metagenome TaxID=412755 RepID=A0A0F9N794_9ZZZZ